MFYIIMHLCGLFPESFFVSPVRAMYLPNLILLRLINLKSANFEGPRYVFFFSVLFSLSLSPVSVVDVIVILRTLC